MADRERTFKSLEGQEVYVHEWAPETPKSALVLVHGLGEHVNRYQHVAEALNQAGYALIGCDLPGHGKTGGVRGHVPSYDLLMSLIKQMFGEAARLWPGVPQFLYGHSMGGNIGLYYAMTQKPEIAGVVITSPGLGTKEKVPAWKKMMGRMLYNMAPSMQMDNGLDRTGLSREPNVQKVYDADPLVHGKISTRLGMDMLDKGRWMIEHASQFPDLPLLLMQGSADRLVDPNLTGLFAKNCQCKQLTYKVWEGYYHELHNEPEKADVLRFMIDWLDAHC